MTYKVIRQDGRAIPGLVFRKRRNAKLCVARLSKKGQFHVKGSHNG